MFVGKNKFKFILLVVFSVLAAGIYFFVDDFGLSLEFIKSNKKLFETYYLKNHVQFVVVFSLIYIMFTGLSIPGANVLSLLAGAIFGTLSASVIISITSTVGATLAFLISRYFLKEFVSKKFYNEFKSFESLVAKNEFSLLVTLRLFPLAPFFLINLFMGTRKISLKHYIFGSWIAMLPGTFIYVHAGQELNKISSVDDVFNVQLLLSFTFLALFPFLSKSLYTRFFAKRGKTS